jgi:PAS domain S-box-containing protein
VIFSKLKQAGRLPSAVGRLLFFCFDSVVRAYFLKYLFTVESTTMSNETTSSTDSVQFQEELAQLRSAREELEVLREELRTSEEKYRTAFEYTGTAMMVMEEDMTVSMANHRIEQITGYELSEIYKKKPWTEYIHPDDLPRMLDYFRKRGTAAHDTVPVEYAFRFMLPSGDPRDLLINVSLIPGNKKRLLFRCAISPMKNA